MLIPLIATLAMYAAADATSKPTLSLAPMQGLETHIEKALRSAEVPVVVVASGEAAELKTSLQKLHRGYAGMLYRVKLGRPESYALELRDARSNQVLARSLVDLSGDAASLSRAAEAFAGQVKKAVLHN